MKIIRSSSLPSVQGQILVLPACALGAPFERLNRQKSVARPSPLKPGARTARPTASSWTNADRDAGARLVTGVGKEAGTAESGGYRWIHPAYEETLTAKLRRRR